MNDGNANRIVPNLNEIDAITFDFCGTLDADGIPWWRRMYDLLFLECPALISESVYRSLYGRVDIYIRELLSGKVVMIEKCVAEHLRAQVAELQISPPRPISELASEFASGVAEGVQHHMNTLIRLQKQGLRLIIISNGYGSLSDWCKHLGLSKVMEAVIDSGNVGVRKPKARIFEIAIKTLGVKKCRILHVGDNLRTDVLGANAVGLQSVWVRRLGEEMPTDPDKRPKYTIGCVNELLGWKLPRTPE